MCLFFGSGSPALIHALWLGSIRWLYIKQGTDVSALLGNIAWELGSGGVELCVLVCECECVCVFVSVCLHWGGVSVASVLFFNVLIVPPQ